ncbi:MAG: IS3 family transposase [Bacteroidaceae bacterium]|nr:IS3 family transposase [Bacteroidaceae bacterium]
MSFIAKKTNDGKVTGKIALYCRALNVSRQGFYGYLAASQRPWRYQKISMLMQSILAEDQCNDTYGRVRMHKALMERLPAGEKVPSINTVQLIMNAIGIGHTKKRKPNGITKAEKNARKSDDLLKRDFKSAAPAKKCVTDITEIKCRNGKLYVSAIFDCYDAAVLGLVMDTNMKTQLCARTVTAACQRYPELRGAIIHSDRGSQYTSAEYRKELAKYQIAQSMNSAGGRCHDNARCESMWARMKEELIYGRIKTTEHTIEYMKKIIWRYFIGYWNNRRICMTNEGLPPVVKRKQYYDKFGIAA